MRRRHSRRPANAHAPPAHGRCARRQLDAAQAAFANALALDPQDSVARDGLQDVALAWAARSEHQASDFRFDDAEHSLARAVRSHPTAPHSPTPTPPRAEPHAAESACPSRSVTPRRAAEVKRLIAAAVAAETRGDLLAPPGDSAFDHLRHARAPGADVPMCSRAALAPAARRATLFRQCAARQSPGARAGLPGCARTNSATATAHSHRRARDSPAAGSPWATSASVRAKSKRRNAQ
jgi:hypothetical protein